MALIRGPLADHRRHRVDVEVHPDKQRCVGRWRELGYVFLKVKAIVDAGLVGFERRAEFLRVQLRISLALLTRRTRPVERSHPAWSNDGKSPSYLEIWRHCKDHRNGSGLGECLISRRTPLSVGKRGANHRTPGLRYHIGKFVQDDVI